MHLLLERAENRSLEDFQAAFAEVSSPKEKVQPGQIKGLNHAVLGLQHHPLPEPLNLQKAEDPHLAVCSPDHVLQDPLEYRHLQINQ